MTLYAILSDIHANYAALLAAARDARAIARREGDGQVEFISLGDVVDYGPQPNECVAWVRRYASVTIQGNHDRVASAPLASPPIEIERNLWPIVLWTRAELRDQHRQALRQWRDQRGTSALTALFTPFHSDLDESDAYINNTRIASRTLHQLKTPYGLFGHTHIQGYYLQNEQSAETVLTWPSDPLPDATTMAQFVATNQWFVLPPDGRRIILNPGSIGQPRQQPRIGGAFMRRDYRAAYMLLRQRADQHWEARFQRVDYPIQETVRRMREQIHWDERRSQIPKIDTHALDGAAASIHPFASQLSGTLAAMETLLPRLVEQLIDQLSPPDNVAG
ncbi:MAG: metallophosphoesterase family protein [Roseiflexaceae bacterium]|nr:metallophosphoesterase family protein [Roseiflexaceae bacterium]